MAKPQEAPALLMPKATAVWLIENTVLTFDQVAGFTGLHKIEVQALADEARTHRFATVCVNSVNVRLMTQLLKGSQVPVCAVVGFPLGAMSPRSKAYETKAF